MRMNFSGSSDAGLACSAAQPAAQPIATKPISQPVHRVLICRQATLLRRKLPSKNTAPPKIATDEKENLDGLGLDSCVQGLDWKMSPTLKKEIKEYIF
ncbi:MAG: hypothetical protein HOB97_05790 [Verrucomicrobia bacterium]|nr:hypothetical protein [Verrucomicrobiota bacterium]